MKKARVVEIQPGRILDAIVAEEVFGYKTRAGVKNDKVEYLPKKYEGEELVSAWGLKETYCRTVDKNSQDTLVYAWVDVPLFSTNIVAAWMVVNKIQSNYVVDISVFQNLWSCRIKEYVYGALYPYLIEEQIYDNAPEAICKAAILAHLDKKE